MRNLEKKEDNDSATIGRQIKESLRGVGYKVKVRIVRFGDVDMLQMDTSNYNETQIEEIRKHVMEAFVSLDSSLEAGWMMKETKIVV